MLAGREVVEYANHPHRPDTVVWVATANHAPGVTAVYFAHYHGGQWITVAPDNRSVTTTRLRYARQWALAGNGRVTRGHAEVKEHVVLPDDQVRALIPA